MFQDSYVKLSPVEVESLIEQTKGLFDGISFGAAQTIVMARGLPFYPEYRFLDMADHSHMPPARRFLLQHDDDFIILDFTNAPIYNLNDTCPIVLIKANVADYVRFFFQFVRGRHGRFLLVESVDDIQWREEPPPAARKSVGKLINPIAFVSSDTDDKIFHLQGQMMFKDSLFQADITVDNSGLVTLSNEKLLIEDMPVLDDTFGQ